VFLPDESQEKLLRDLMISAFALKAVQVANLIWRQANVDIFFLDWERPRPNQNHRMKATRHE
jgi:hypothetical protein